MSDFSERFERLTEQGRRLAARVRPQHLAVLAGVVVIGVGVASAGGLARSGPPSAPDDPRLRIQVVTPVEPEIMPGSVMEVGELVDGFVSVPPRPPAVASDGYAFHDDPAEVPAPPKGADPYVEAAIIQAPPQPGEPTDDRRGGRVSRWLGFDAPEPDYRAEREARRARLDARAGWDRDRRDLRRSPPEGAAPD